MLDPIDRVTEVLFGLIMVMTFTGSLSVVEAGNQQVRTMLIGALGCNLAWGIIDGVLFLMGCLAERGGGLRRLRALRATSDPDKARRLLAEALPTLVANVLRPAEYQAIHERLKLLPDPPGEASLRRGDWLGGLAVCLLVFLSTLPVVVPFILWDEPMRALRVSHSIAIAMLFVTGYAFGRCAGRHPWLTGFAMLLLGVALAGIAMVLGG